MKESTFENLHYVERIARIIFGYGLIFSVLFQPVPLQYLVVLPLVAIYPCLTGLLGWDPFYDLLKINSKSTDVVDKGAMLNIPFARVNHA